MSGAVMMIQSLSVSAREFGEWWQGLNIDDCRLTIVDLIPNCRNPARLRNILRLFG
jgi:hypothetical protein